MKSKFFYILALVFLPVIALAQSADYVPGEVIVKFKKDSYGPTTLGKVAAKAQVKHIKTWRGHNLHQFSMKTSDSMPDVLKRLRADRDVAYAEPNFYVYETNTESYGATNAAINVVESWEIVSDSPTTEEEAPILAVVDSGLDIHHPIFDGTGRLWTNLDESKDRGSDKDQNGYFDDVHGYNFRDRNTDLSDLTQHGTHVAGIALGVSENIYKGFDSNSPTHVRIMPLKFLNSEGVGRTSDAIEAIYYAVDNGAKVISNSWGGSNYSAALHEALTYAYEHEVIIVAAAGNFHSDNNTLPIYPANYDIPSLISVAATDTRYGAKDYLASFSNYGSQTVHIAAPGVSILSSVAYSSGDDKNVDCSNYEYIAACPYYGVKSGTSMAAPFISGLAAVLMREAPTMTGYQIKQKILDSGDYIPQLEGYVKTSKRMDAQKAVEQIQAQVHNKIAAPYQPNYSPVYQQGGGRNLSSTSFESGFGCGSVRQMYTDTNSNLGQKNPSRQPTGLVIVLLLAPMALVLALKYKFRQDDRRKDARKRVLIPANIVTEKGMVQAVQVMCWSASGAGLQLADGFEPDIQGQCLTLKLKSKFGNVTIPTAQVVRQNESGYVGLKFLDKQESKTSKKSS